MRITIIKIDLKTTALEDYEFPKLNQKFQNDVGIADDKTKSIEDAGAGLMDSPAKGGGFHDAERVGAFVERIYNWGGYGSRGIGLLDQLREKYSDNTIAQIVDKAAAMLTPLNFNLASAFDKITSLDGLGEIYGSAILRMLSPRYAAMGAYAYKKDGEGNITLSPWPNLTGANYADFCKFCETDIIAELKKKGIDNPCRENGEWFVADIEAAMTCREKGYA